MGISGVLENFVTHMHTQMHTHTTQTHTHRLSLAWLWTIYLLLLELHALAQDTRFYMLLPTVTRDEPRDDGLSEVEKCGSSTARAQATRVRACNSIKFETVWNLPPVLKIVTHVV